MAAMAALKTNSFGSTSGDSSIEPSTPTCSGLGVGVGVGVGLGLSLGLGLGLGVGVGVGVGLGLGQHHVAERLAMGWGKEGLGVGVG